LYGCGDLLTDDEGITGHEQFRSELGALYVPTFDTATDRLEQLSLVPTRMLRFRLTTPATPGPELVRRDAGAGEPPLGIGVAQDDQQRLHIDW
jgi:poly-gamma-glutamate synthesis protein (capsule biosynthesis protein)